MDKKLFTQEQIMGILDGCYNTACNGIPGVSDSIDKLANDYLSKDKNPAIAGKKMINNQITKCTTSGFITGFGGLITLPIAIPANLSSVLYVQIRMIACTAYMGGYDVKSDQVKTLIYACLAGISVNEVIKKAGIKVGEKVANNMIAKIPGAALVKINQRVGFRFITKFGEKGILNLGKMVPGVGAIINGGLDYAETKAIGNRAYKMFIENDFSVGD